MPNQFERGFWDTIKRAEAEASAPKSQPLGVFDSTQSLLWALGRSAGMAALNGHNVAKGFAKNVLNSKAVDSRIQNGKA